MTVHDDSCDDCHAVTPDLYQTVYGSLICQECRDEYYIKCSECGALVVEEDAVDMENDERDVLCPVCIDRYEFCKSCGKPVVKESIGATGACDECESELSR